MSPETENIGAVLTEARGAEGRPNPEGAAYRQIFKSLR